jgi:hypothetical protein
MLSNKRKNNALLQGVLHFAIAYATLYKIMVGADFVRLLARPALEGEGSREIIIITIRRCVIPQKSANQIMCKLTAFVLRYEA